MRAVEQVKPGTLVFYLGRFWEVIADRELAAVNNFASIILPSGTLVCVVQGEL